MSETTRITAITGGNVIDGTGAKPMGNATVIIKDSKIEAVGHGIGIPDGAQIIDAVGKTVMPGLIDAHIHYMGAGPMRGFRVWPREMSLIKSISDAKTLLNYGFTTTKDCGGLNAIYMRDSAKAGYLEGIPRIIAAGHVVVPTNNGLDDPSLPEACADARTNVQTEFLISDGVDTCLKSTRMAIRRGADFIKIFNSGNYAFGHCSDHVTLFTDNEIKAIVQVAKQAEGRSVSAHCQSNESSRQAILCGVKCIEHAIGVDEETVKLGIECGAIFTSAMTFATCEPQLNSIAWESMVAGYTCIHELGGLLAIGSDMNSSPMFQFGNNAKEMELLVKHCRFTPLEAIAAGTKNGAIACGIENKTGTLEAGKLADIILVNRNPLADITVLQQEENIETVMLEGKIEVDRSASMKKTLTPTLDCRYKR